MSVKAPKRELIHLIYRHLKEHGFHSAAEELQIRSPQGNTNISISLLDIYSSWLKDSNQKKESDPTKPSTFKEKRKTPHKATASKKQATSTDNHAEGDCDAHGEELSQSLLPQTPVASSNSPVPRTPIKPVAQSPGTPVRLCPHVAAAPSDSSDTTDISEEKAKITPVRQQKSNSDAADQEKTGPAKKKKAVKDQTLKKQAVAVTTPPTGKAKKKVDKSAKKDRHQKKSVPVKRKKTGENSTIAKNPKTSMKAEVAGRDSSDSDSSLDVEKWKKMVLNLTETDVAKMEAINALDSSAPKPKKKRENKPLTKPPAKAKVQPPQSDKASNENGPMLGGGVTQTSAKDGKTKKNRSRKTASLSSSDAMNSNTDTIEVTPSPSIPSLLKDPLEEENVNVAAHSEKKIDQKSDKKKKKKKMNEDTLGENLKEALKEEINKESLATDNKICNDHGNKKDAKGNVDNSKELIGNVEITESIIQQKKLKKKKKNKSEDVLEHITEGEINSEKTAEEDNTVQLKKAKKNKKKEKTDADSPEKIIRVEEMQMGETETEENSQQISNEVKRKKKRKHREGDSELVVENRNVFEEQKVEENVTNHSECTDKEENHRRTVKLKNKSKKGPLIKNDVMVLLPSQETLGLPSEKKKKKKSTEVQDCSASF